jgi:hypothetical protein
MTHATEKIRRENAEFEYDPETESVVEKTTGQTVYRETGIGEIDLRAVMRGELFWHGCSLKGCTDPACGKKPDGTRDPFTFNDFVSEIVIPDLESARLFDENA